MRRNFSAFDVFQEVGVFFCLFVLFCFACITKTRLYNFDFKPHFYILKQVFTGYTLIYLFC